MKVPSILEIENNRTGRDINFAKIKYPMLIPTLDRKVIVKH